MLVITGLGGAGESLNLWMDEVPPAIGIEVRERTREREKERERERLT